MTKLINVRINTFIDIEPKLNPFQKGFAHFVKRLYAYLLAVLLPMFSYAQTEDANQSLKSLYDSLYEYERKGDLQDGIRFGYQILEKTRQVQDNLLEAKTRHTLSKLLSYNDLADSSKVLARSNIKFGEEIRDYNVAMEAANLMATFYFNESKYDSSEFYFKYCMETAKIHLPNRYPIALTNMAFINGYSGQDETEMTYYFQALRTVLEKPELDNTGRVRAMAYGGIGDYYMRINEYEKAAENYEAKLTLGNEKNNKRMIFEASYGLGNVFRVEENFDFEKSDKYYKLMLTDTTRAFSQYRGRALIGLGRLYSEDEKYTEALKYFQSAYLAFKDGPGKDYIARIEILIGQIFLKRGQIDSADEWLKKGLKNALTGGLALREKEALKSLYKVDSIKSNFWASLKKYQRYRAIEDSLFTKESAEKLSTLQVEYETQKSERENLILKSDLSLSEANLEKQKLIQWIITAAIVIAVFAIIVLVRIYRRKQASNLQLESQNKLITTQKEELSFKTDKLELVNSQLQSLAEFRTDLTQMIAHDMKNPLNSIIGLSSIDPNDKHFKNITQSGYQLLNLVTNMLEVEKFQATDYVPKAVPTPLDQIILESRKRVEILLEAKSIRFESLIPKLICVSVDPEPIKRVFVNLISNAIKYSPTEGKIIVDKLKVVDNNIWIKVVDQGAGISPDRLPYVFEKFWQTNAKESGFAASTGLGLTFCKMTVEAHGGKIWAESEIGKGTSIYLTLPLETSQTCEKALSELNENVGDKHENEEVLIGPNELAGLVEHAEFLKDLKIHQVSAINRILNDLEKKGIQSKWQTKLQATIYQADQDKYDELLKYLLEFNSNNS